MPEMMYEGHLMGKYNAMQKVNRGKRLYTQTWVTNSRGEKCPPVALNPLVLLKGRVTANQY